MAMTTTTTNNNNNNNNHDEQIKCKKTFLDIGISEKLVGI